MADQVPQAESAERLQRLQAAITRHWHAFNAQSAGRTVEVLLEKPGKLPGPARRTLPYYPGRARDGGAARP